MANEPGKLMYRRFMGRFLESALLVLAIALGVGATTAGLSLLLEIRVEGDKMLALPLYREIQVSTRAEIDSMSEPAVEKLTQNRTRLSASDLEAAELVDTVSAAYIKNDFELRFLTKELMERFNSIQANGGGVIGFAGGPPDGAGPPPDIEVSVQAPQSSENPASTNSAAASNQAAPSTVQAPAEGEGNNQNNQNRDTNRNTNRNTNQNTNRNQGFNDIQKTLETALSDPSVLISEAEQISGFRVSSGYFTAWKLETKVGSLFTEEDFTKNSSNVLLGASAWQAIAGKDIKTEDLIGRRILTMQGFQTIIGILKPSGDSIVDSSVFSPFRTGAAQAGFGGMRTLNGQTVLSFSVKDARTLGATSEALGNYFTNEYGEDQVVISNPRNAAEQALARNTGIATLILFLALAGLFIASVNVSHILMSRGLRMRKNVGILMALGASKTKILELFAKEALAISAIGACIGIAFAIPLSLGMQASLASGTGNFLTILVSALGASLLTLAFTLVPAWQNSRIDPAQAMRYV